ncbi:ATP synthase subunit C lysine N-methyltransferase [Drosophila sulfurigaster albostrigata]|uniref:ATP synthase subunit C lysine N-methyltransferase n=1 Tax=Drosophila sulfurigaster albostrigata TaxID=89887 RepID=UPI002D21D662|nr:ATP synthase subunit C lysine N-methyltransferase [Drosophila sulfurigaster albostrigata]
MEVLNESDHKTVPKRGMSTGGKVLIGVTGGVGLGLSIVCASFVAPAFRKFCLPYVPATTEQIQNVLNFLPKNATGKLLDIGSGDGRIVVAAAQHVKALKTDGVELNPWLVYYSRLAALRYGVGKQSRFFRRDLWKFNIKEYNYVVIFGVEQMMQDLEHKLIAECPHNAKIIACRFPLPQLEPQRIIEDGVNTVWFYDLSKQSRPENNNS